MTRNLRTWDAWHHIHQPFELNWWKEHLPNGHLDDPGFTAQWVEVRDWIQPTGHVIDIGCGPRPPFRPSTVIEPLAEQYMSITPPEWWDDVAVHSVPAENRVEGLKGDTLVCWNCLDHTIGWREILANMRYYANPGAKFAIATDFHEPFDGHPGYAPLDFHEEIRTHFNVRKRRAPFGREVALLLEAK